MYLSKLVLDQHSRTVRRDLADCHNLHRTLMSAFPQTGSNTPRDEFGLLYRIETNSHGGTIAVIVQSQIEPDWSRLQPGYLLDDENNPACKPIASHYDKLQPKQRLIFRLRANPTKRISSRNTTQGSQWQGKRIELRKEEDQIAWLQRKGETTGFRLLSVHINHDVPNVQTATEPKVFGRREKGRLSFGSVLFKGELEITDIEKFKQALADGIGSGKAYGFGLLSIAPAQ